MEVAGAERRIVKAISLLYHDVVDSGHEDESGFPGRSASLYKLTWSLFEEHLEALTEAGATPVLVDEESRGHQAGRPLLLTFDDGGASAERIGERLARLGWPAHFFVPSDFVGRRAFLDAERIRALHELGHLVGSHSCSHPSWMSRCSWEQLLREWSASVDRLSEILDERVEVGSVPGGHYSAEVARAAAAAGIKVLFTSEPRMSTWEVDGCLVIGRYSIQRQTPASTAGRLARGRRVARLRQHVVWNTKKAAKAVGGDAYLRGRDSLLRRL